MIIPGSLNTKSSCVLTRMIFVDKSMKIWLLFSPCSFWQSVLIYGQHICYKIGFVLSAVSHLCCHLHQIKWLLEHEAKKQHHHIVSKETALSAVVTLFFFFFLQHILHRMLGPVVFQPVWVLSRKQQNLKKKKVWLQYVEVKACTVIFAPKFGFICPDPSVHIHPYNSILPNPSVAL